MRISRVYTESDLEVNATVELEEKASHYLSTVLRLRAGAKLLLFNNDGYQYPADIYAIKKKKIFANILAKETIANESPLNIHLGIAMSKGDRMDLVIQKATELGVTQITPLCSERTEVRLKSERISKKLRHWQQVSISACEQCGRNKLPVIHNIEPLASWLASVNAERKFVLHHRSESCLQASDKTSKVALLIGPEGGLSEEEIKLAQTQEFTPLRLGPRILRTETAPLASIAVLQYIWGDF